MLMLEKSSFSMRDQALKINLDEPCLTKYQRQKGPKEKRQAWIESLETRSLPRPQLMRNKPSMMRLEEYAIIPPLTLSSFKADDFVEWRKGSRLDEQDSNARWRIESISNATFKVTRGTIKGILMLSVFETTPPSHARLSLRRENARNQSSNARCTY